jgi:hypothetical protein
MALIHCKECRREISDQAVACPHCGRPISEPATFESDRPPPKPGLLQQRIGCSQGFLMFLLGLFLLGVLGRACSSSPTSSLPAAPSAPTCNAAGADQMIPKLKALGIIYKIDANREVPRIYVKDAWYGLAMDEKQTFDGVLQCHLTRGVGGRRLIIYHDYRTNKEVATSKEQLEVER